MAVILAALIQGYVVIGLGFGLWFAWWGAERLDPVAEHGTTGFRFLLLPGAVALWPYLLLRVVRGGPAPPEERSAHRRRVGRPAGRTEPGR